MSVDIAALRSALSTAVGTITGLRTSSLVPDQINPPEAVIYRRAIEYDLDYTGGSTYHFGVSVYAIRNSERASQNFLDNLCEPTGSTSLKVAVETNAALDVLCDWVRVMSVSEVQVTTIGQVDYLSVEFLVDVVV